jgi:hypothetical protein
MAVFLVRTASALGVVVPAPVPQGFGDLGGLGQQAVDAINQVKQLGITAGTSPTTYGPHDGVPRWQMALLLTRLYTAVGASLPAAGSGFSDLAGLSPEAVTAINQLAALQISTGTGGGNFAPATIVTREQMASFLARLIRLL